MSDSMNVDDFLEHHGVKGMRWGVRKAEGSSSRPSKTEIKTARTNQAVRRNDVKTAKDSGDVAAVQKAKDAFNNAPDRITAAHLTRDEQGASIALQYLGVASGLATLSANHASNLSVGKQVTNYAVDSLAGVLAPAVQGHRVKKLSNNANA
jgi:hypothetical protein